MAERSPLALGLQPRPTRPVSQPISRPHWAEAERGFRYKALLLLVVTVPLIGLGLAVAQLWDRLVTWQDLALLLGLYVPIAFGVTAGYHRMLTHRSFEAQPIVRALLLILGSMALEGNCIGWAADHRLHHQLSDQEGDPHSPTDGLLHAHLGWLLSGRAADPEVYCKQLLQDPVVCWVDRTFGLWAALGLLVPFVLGGWQGLLWGGLVRVFLVHHVTWSVNSVCHTWGARPYATTDRSRNNWLVAIFSFGEGWHNAHHRWPRSAVHGMDRWQLDVSAWLIQLFEWLHLARQVCRIPAEARAHARDAGATAPLRRGPVEQTPG